MKAPTRQELYKIFEKVWHYPNVKQDIDAIDAVLDALGHVDPEPEPLRFRDLEPGEFFRLPLPGTGPVHVYQRIHRDDTYRVVDEDGRRRTCPDDTCVVRVIPSYIDDPDQTP